MFKIIRLKFSEKLFIYLFCLFLGLIPTAKAGVVGNYVSKILQMPMIDKSESEEVFVCPASDYYEYDIYSSFFSQVGTFIPAVGLLFTVGVYGTTSVFSYITTCHIDDVVIFTVTLAPIFAWYTLAKPIWLYKLISGLTLDVTDIDTSLYMSDIDNDDVVIITLFVSFASIIILMALIKIYFHKYHKSKRSKRFFNGLKTFIIWIFLIHSLEVITYSILEYIFIFSKMLNLMEKFQLESGLHSTKSASMFNLLTINYLSNLLYFFAATSLVISYHFPNLQRKIFFFTRIETNHYQGFVRKKTFFFTITLCIFHIFYEYYWFCTPPIIGTIFNTVIVTILARSITSYFSESAIKCVHKHNKEDEIYAQLKPENIGKVKNFYIGDSLYKVHHFKGQVYVYDSNSEKYYYVIFDDDSAYFFHLSNVNKQTTQDEILEIIKRLMDINKICLIHGCENFEQKRQEVINNHSKEMIEIKDHVLVNVIRTGILNYIVYSHRCSKSPKKDQYV